MEDLNSSDNLDRLLNLLPVPHDGDQGVLLPAGVEEVNKMRLDQQILSATRIEARRCK